MKNNALCLLIASLLNTAAVAYPVDPSERESDYTEGILPHSQLFAPLVADPRQPVFSLQYQQSNSDVQDFGAGIATLGQYLPIYEDGFAGGRIELGLQAGVFALFKLGSKDLINTDFNVAIPMTYRHGNWSYRAMIQHVSSHLGDDLLLQETGERPVDVDPDDFGFEAVEVMASYDFPRLRLYGGGGYIISSKPDLDEPYVQLGAEYRIPQVAGPMDFLAATDVRSWQEHDWEPSVSILVGLARRREQRELRFMLELYDGFSPHGLFYTERLEYVGFGIFYHY